MCGRNAAPAVSAPKSNYYSEINEKQTLFSKAHLLRSRRLQIVFSGVRTGVGKQLVHSSEGRLRHCKQGMVRARCSTMWHSDTPALVLS